MLLIVQPLEGVSLSREAAPTMLRLVSRGLYDGRIETKGLIPTTNRPLHVDDDLTNSRCCNTVN